MTLCGVETRTWVGLHASREVKHAPHPSNQTPEAGSSKVLEIWQESDCSRGKRASTGLVVAREARQLRAQQLAHPAYVVPQARALRLQRVSLRVRKRVQPLRGAAAVRGLREPVFWADL